MNQYLDSSSRCVNSNCQYSRLISTQFEFQQHSERNHKIVKEDEFYEQIKFQLQQDIGYFEDNLLVDFKDILNETEQKLKNIIYDYIEELYLIVKREIEKHCFDKYKQQQTLIQDLPLDKQCEFLTNPSTYLQRNNFQQITDFFQVKLKSANDIFMQHCNNQLLDFEFIFAITKPQQIQMNNQSIQIINIDHKPNNLFQPIQNIDCSSDKAKINKTESNKNKYVQTEQIMQKFKEVQTESNKIQMNEQLIQQLNLQANQQQIKIDTLSKNQIQLTQQNQELLKLKKQLELKQSEQEKALIQFQLKEQQQQLAKQQYIQEQEKEKVTQKKTLKISKPFEVMGLLQQSNQKQSNSSFARDLSDKDVLFLNSQISVQNSLTKLIFQSKSSMVKRMIKFSLQQNPVESTYFQIKIGMINLNDLEESTTMNKTGQIFEGKRIITQVRDIDLLSKSLIQMEIAQQNKLQITADNQLLTV